MRNKLQISVPEPCSNRWEDMTRIDDNNRHCASCEKTITDFTKLSDVELLAYFRSNTVSCGMFARHQLNRTLQQPKKKRNNWLSAFILPAFLAVTDANAQAAKQPALVELQSDSIDRSVRVPVKDVFPTLKDTVMVSGRVLEETDSLKEYPLYGAVLLFHLNDSTTQGCVAGIDGNFIIKLGHVKIGDTITVEVKYTGYQPYFTTIVLRNPEIKHTDIILRGEAAITDSHIVGAIPAENHPVRAKIRRFFWRLFHPLYWGL